MSSIRQAVEYLYWEGLEPKQIVLELQRRGKIGSVDTSILTEERVTEMIAETVVARKLETTYHEVLNSIHPHPTISESIKDAIEVAYGEAIHL